MRRVSCERWGDLEIRVLSTFHVELCLSLVLSAVKSDEFDSHEIVAGSYAGGHGEVVPSAIGDHGIDSPSATIQTVLSNLKPLKATGSSSSGIVNLGEVDHDRA